MIGSFLYSLKSAMRCCHSLLRLKMLSLSMVVNSP
jgi:hypothetical protein